MQFASNAVSTNTMQAFKLLALPCLVLIASSVLRRLLLLFFSFSFFHEPSVKASVIKAAVAA